MTDISDSTDSVTREKQVAAPPERVWQAISDHREFSTWFRAELEAPFAIGAIVEGKVFDPEGNAWPMSLRVTAMKPESYFAFEWQPHIPENQTRAEAPWTQVEFHIEPEGGGTRITVTESGFDKLPEEAREKIRNRNAGGWEIQLENIATHVGG